MHMERLKPFKQPKGVDLLTFSGISGAKLLVKFKHVIPKMFGNWRGLEFSMPTSCLKIEMLHVVYRVSVKPHGQLFQRPGDAIQVATSFRDCGKSSVHDSHHLFVSCHKWHETMLFKQQPTNIEREREIYNNSHTYKEFIYKCIFFWTVYIVCVCHGQKSLYWEWSSTSNRKSL